MRPIPGARDSADSFTCLSNFVCAMPSTALSYPGACEGVTVPLKADTPAPGKDARKISLWTEIDRRP